MKHVKEQFANCTETMNSSWGKKRKRLNIIISGVGGSKAKPGKSEVLIQRFDDTPHRGGNVGRARKLRGKVSTELDMNRIRKCDLRSNTQNLKARPVRLPYCVGVEFDTTEQQGDLSCSKKPNEAEQGHGKGTSYYAHNRYGSRRSPKGATNWGVSRGLLTFSKTRKSRTFQEGELQVLR